MLELISNEIAALEKKIEELRGWNEVAEDVCKIVKGIDKKYNPRVLVGCQIGYLNGILVHVNISKAADISALLALFLKEGFHIQGEPSEYAEIRRKTWKLKREKNGAPVQFSAFFYETDSASCRYVKVGEEIKPVYKLVCPDEAPSVPALVADGGVCKSGHA